MATSLAGIRSGLSTAMAGVAAGSPAADEPCLACEALLGVDGAAGSVVYAGASRGTFGSSGEASRRLDEYQFTSGQGPCLDAVAAREMVLVPDLRSPQEHRWPFFAGAALEDGIHGVFALPITVASVCVGALDLLRESPGPLSRDHLSGAMMAAELASLPLLGILASPDRAGSDTERQLDDRLVAEGEDAWGHLASMDRIEVYQATGILIAQLDVDAAEALIRLRAHAFATGQTASQVAWAIVERRLHLDRDEQDGSGRSLR